MISKAIQDCYPPELNYCYGCGAKNKHGLQIKTLWDGEKSICTFYPKPYHAAIPGFVYGGLIASLIDCHGTGTAAAAAYHAQSRPFDSDPPIRYVTASLHINFLKPTPIDQGPLVLHGYVKELKGRKAHILVELMVNDIICANGEVIVVHMPKTMQSKPVDSAIFE